MGLALAYDQFSALLSVSSQRWLLRALIFRTWSTFTIALRCTRWKGYESDVLHVAQGLRGQVADGARNDHTAHLGWNASNFADIQQNIFIAVRPTIFRLRPLAPPVSVDCAVRALGDLTGTALETAAPLYRLQSRVSFTGLSR